MKDNRGKRKETDFLTGQDILRRAFRAFSMVMEKDRAWDKARDVVLALYRLTPLQLACTGAEKIFDGQILHEMMAQNPDLTPPCSRLTGVRFFHKRYFELNEATLDPRWESQGLLPLIQEARTDGKSVLDLGTGSGCLLISLLEDWPQSRGVGVDISPRALEAAMANGKELGERARWVQGDWFSPIEGELFDVIVSNPPYVCSRQELETEVTCWDPALALYGGQGGLEAYQRFVPQIQTHLAPGGLVALEIGWDQAQAVCGLLRQAGFERMTVHKDWDHKDRYILTQNSLGFGFTSL